MRRLHTGDIPGVGEKGDRLIVDRAKELIK
jgi:long-subunit acyl-CoA synthetase (AMP-forming)